MAKILVLGEDDRRQQKYTFFVISTFGNLFLPFYDDSLFL